MNSKQFITQSVALGALLVGFSGLSLAGTQVQCGDPVTCAPGDTGPNQQLPMPDSTGSVTVPANLVQYAISVAKFDPALAAAVEGTTPDKIKLQRVSVTLTLQVEDFDLNVQNVDTTSSCVFDLTYLIDAKILQNATLGTGEIAAQVDLSVPPTPLTAYDGVAGGSDSLQRTLLDYPANDIFHQECVAQEGDLSAWIGPGAAMWTLDVIGVNVPNGCPQSFQGVSSHIRADVSVDYDYCVEPDCTQVCFFCFGDGGDCPCGADFATGGCKNSTGMGATLSATGSGDYAADDLTFTASNLPANVPIIWFMAQSTTRYPLTDGLMCLGPSGGGLKIFRIQTSFSGPGGTSVLGPGIIQMSIAHPLPLAEIHAGDTWYFQAYYRDVGSPCGGNANLTNAAQVIFF